MQDGSKTKGFLLENNVLIDGRTIRYYNLLFNKYKRPLIEDSQESLITYLSFIDSLKPDQKGEDFGICALIMANLQGKKADLGSGRELRELAFKAQAGLIYHVMYLRKLHELELRANINIDDLPMILIEGAFNIISNFPDNVSYEFDLNDPFQRHKEIGIKMVEFVSEQILD